MFTQAQYRFWLPIEEESFEGLFLTKEEISELEVKRSIYIFETQSGTLAVRGTPTLDEQMAHVDINDRVRILFLGLRDDSNWVRWPAYRVWKNEWTPLSKAEEYDKDGILML